MINNDRRERLVEIFEDTMELCRDKSLAEGIKKSIDGTVLYAPNDTPEAECRGYDTVISVTRERSLECAGRLREKYPDGRIGVHNFASATNPGGGVTRGSSAQEEAICRCTSLYPCLKTDRLFREFYNMHRGQNDLRYTDSCIYTPGVAVVKSDTDFPEALPEDRRFYVDVLTCAAPNLREKPYNAMNPGSGVAIKVSRAELTDIHKSRGAHMLAVAAANNIDVLILGAFGCGAFRNDPAVVAQTYKDAVARFSGYFREVCFAVYCSPGDSRNYDVFDRVIGGGR